MARDILLIVDDILRMISVIETALTGKRPESFQEDVVLRLGIQRAIEIISEASKHIPDPHLAEMPDIPWRLIRGMGNILRHEYHRIADQVIWDVIAHDLPPLKSAMLGLQERLSRA